VCCVVARQSRKQRSRVVPSYTDGGPAASNTSFTACAQLRTQYMGNILVNPRVGLLFVDFEQPHRMRVNGTATLAADDPLMAEFPGAQLIVRVTAEHIFPNCPRYVHRMQLVERSVYAPRPHYEPPVPDWKRMVEFRDALPRQDHSASDS
jgi:Pyridoxamine 5'-phosphate oxidase